MTEDRLTIPLPLPPLPSLEWEEWTPVGPFPLPPIPEWASNPFMEITIEGKDIEKRLTEVFDAFDMAAPSSEER